MNRFWKWVRDETGGAAPRTLSLEGTIAEESWFDDDVTPAAFKKELMAGSGPIVVAINSPGGDVFAAAQIYNMLMDYPGDVTVKIDALAASAASVIAMAGTKVLISPVGMLMVHNPMTLAIGDSDEMRRAIGLLDEVKAGIMNAYELKTGLSRARLSHLMDAETWMSAGKAIELGFADGVLYEEDGKDERNPGETQDSFVFSRCAITNSILDKIRARAAQRDPTLNSVPGSGKRVSAAALEARLNLLEH